MFIIDVVIIVAATGFACMNKTFYTCVYVFDITLHRTYVYNIFFLFFWMKNVYNLWAEHTHTHAQYLSSLQFYGVFISSISIASSRCKNCETETYIDVSTLEKQNKNKWKSIKKLRQLRNTQSDHVPLSFTVLILLFFSICFLFAFVFYTHMHAHAHLKQKRRRRKKN